MHNWARVHGYNWVREIAVVGIYKEEIAHLAISPTEIEWSLRCLLVWFCINKIIMVSV